MDKAIREALSGLIPAFSGELPAELVELATSLVVQSRSKASSLKKDEEIARPYACANLACERYEIWKKNSCALVRSNTQKTDSSYR